MVQFSHIRYIAKIERRLTHNVDFKGKNSFEKGIKFHYLIDQIWNKLIRSSDYIISLKFLEDEILYDKIDDWREYINFFDKVTKDELLLNIPEEKIKEWYEILQRYFSEKPNNSIRRKILTDLEFSKELPDRMNRNIDLMKKDQKIIKTINEFYNNIESLIEKYDQ